MCNESNDGSDAGDAETEGIALIPVLDLLNHNPAQHVAWHTGLSKGDNFQFLTKTAIKMVNFLL